MQLRRLVLVTLVGARRRALDNQQAAADARKREELHAMVVAAMPMVDGNARSIARRVPAQIDMQDLVDAGYLALVQAAQKFDPSRGVPLEAYARQKVRGAMWDLVRRRNWREMSHEEIDPEAIETIDDGADPHAMLEAKRRHEMAHGAMECLSDRERVVVTRFYGGNGLAAIGKELGLCRDTVCDIHRLALRKMQRHFALRGIKAA